MSSLYGFVALAFLATSACTSIRPSQMTETGPRAPNRQLAWTSNEDTYTAVGTTATFMKDIISQPFPDEVTKIQRVKAVLPEIERLRNAAGDVRRINWDLVNAGLNFKESKGEAQLDSTPRKIEEVLIKMIDANGENAGGFSLTLVGNAVMEADWSDRFGVNRVFLFDGIKPVESIPLTDYILNGIPQSQVVLRRTNYGPEYQAWVDHNIAGLIQLGHKTGGFSVNVLYFHLGDVTTYKAPGSTNEIKLSIQKSALEDLNKRGFVRMGYIGTGGQDWMIFETVILQDGWSSVLNYFDPST